MTLKAQITIVIATICFGCAVEYLEPQTKLTDFAQPILVTENHPELVKIDQSALENQQLSGELLVVLQNKSNFHQTACRQTDTLFMIDFLPQADCVLKIQDGVNDLHYMISQCTPDSENKGSRTCHLKQEGDIRINVQRRSSHEKAQAINLHHPRQKELLRGRLSREGVATDIIDHFLENETPEILHPRYVN